MNHYISILIPAFNSGNWLDGCLESVAQAIDQDCEVIIVDDGSSDDTARIAESYADRDSRFYLIRTEHKGQLAARKEAFEMSQGDYVLMLNSDDILTPRSIESLRSLIVKSTTPPRIIIPNRVLVNKQLKTRTLMGPSRLCSAREVVSKILCEKFPTELTGKLLAREVLENVDWSEGSDSVRPYEIFAFNVLNNIKPFDEKTILIDPITVLCTTPHRIGRMSERALITASAYDEVWETVKAKCPDPFEVSLWGLDQVRHSFIERGIPFDKTFVMANEVLAGLRNKKHLLDIEQRETLKALGSLRFRNAMMKKLAVKGPLTLSQPHLSFIISVHKDGSAVKRTIKSIFSTGFRNIEVVLVDDASDMPTSIILNQINIMYPRVRVVKTGSYIGIVEALARGLAAAEGRLAMYVASGDRITREGVYDAVVQADMGADCVLVNSRSFSRLTGLKGKIRCDRKWAGDCDPDVDMYRAVRQQLDAAAPEFMPHIHGNVWNTQTLRRVSCKLEAFENIESDKLRHHGMSILFDKPMRVVAQKEGLATYEFAAKGFMQHIGMD